VSAGARRAAGRSRRPDSGVTDRFRFRAMTQTDAEAIASWHYPEPFSFYDWTADEDDLADLLDPAARGDRYRAVEDLDGELIGYFSFKPAGPETIEIGLGLRPDHTGRGLGASFVEEGLRHARSSYEPRQFSLAVATFNRRAIKVYERAGFAATRTYMHHTNGGDWEFVEMRRPA
jgi:[ribosomal protein S18]-alanine N-acetyltransferase